ncbi:TrbC/VirB2 family protein [Candidatus Falkowbacteria bacterium]|nr:TrbC/VirB2 family protein [Candidatus Falkowbacteria bacterium]
MTKTKKALVLLSIIMVTFLWLCLLPNALAQTTGTPTDTSADAGVFKLQVPFGSLPVSGLVDIGQYIKALYVFGSAVVVVLAIVMIMASGVQWITSGGDSGKISKAKEGIIKALIGLIIALFAVFILQLVSPGAVDFSPLALETVVCCKSGTEYKLVSSNECIKIGDQVDMTLCGSSTITPSTQDCAAFQTPETCIAPCVWTASTSRCSMSSKNPESCSTITDEGTCDSASSLGCIWVTNAFCGARPGVSLVGGNPCPAYKTSTECSSNGKCQWYPNGGCTDQTSQSKLTCSDYNDEPTCPVSVCYWNNSCLDIKPTGSPCNNSKECGKLSYCSKNTPHVCKPDLSSGACCYGIAIDDDDYACSKNDCRLIGNEICSWTCE